MSFAAALRWKDLFGGVFGSEDQALLFYTLIKMQGFEQILEIGTGLGASAIMMARAVKENGRGRVYTIDDGRAWNENEPLRALVRDRVASDRELSQAFSAERGPLEYRQLLEGAAHFAGVEDAITLLDGEVPLADTVTLPPALQPALARPIDLLYADLSNGPVQVITAIAKFLPYVAPCASIFIDSAAAYLDSFLVLRDLVQALEQNKIPEVLLAGRTGDEARRLAELVARRRFTLVPIRERKERHQSGLVWLRIEPSGPFAHPIGTTLIRGRWRSAATIEGFEDHGVWEDR